MTRTRQTESPNTATALTVRTQPGRVTYPVAARLALIGVTIAWLVLLALIARHRVFDTHDSLISYAHSWWIDRQLWHGHGIPWRMPVLGHGEALTYPYGMLPITVAGVLWPLAGEYAVTGVLVAGAVGLIAAIFWAFPEARQPWWAVLVLVNPPLIAAPLYGQVPFMWACALLTVGIGCWRRGHRRWAVVLVGLAQLCHAAVVLPIAAVIVLLRLRWEPHPRQLVTGYLLSLCLAVPGVVAVLQSPVFSESSPHTELVQFVGTVLVRALVLAPALAAAWPVRIHPRVLPALAVAVLSLNVPLLGPLDTSYAWGALTRTPDGALLNFTATAEFRPGATYRLVRVPDEKVGMYQLIRHGARLDSEFFPESMYFGNFGSTRAYSNFLVRRHVDNVLITNLKDRDPTDEGLLLQAMAAAGDHCTATAVGVRLVAHHPGWDDYAIDHSCRVMG